MNRQLQFGFRRSIDVQLQTEATECGLACISMIATFHGYDTDLPTLRRRFSPSLKGLTLVDLLKIGAALDLAGRAVRLEPEELHMLRLPCILHWDFSRRAATRLWNASAAITRCWLILLSARDACRSRNYRCILAAWRLS